MMKRMMALLLALMMVLSMTTTVWATETGGETGGEGGETTTPPPAAHTHSYTMTSSTKATCTEDGTKTYTCSNADGKCDKITYTEAEAAPGHAFNLTKSTSTCTAAGENTYTCSRCSATKTEPGTQLEHNYSVFVSTTASCNTAGEETYKCATCDLTTKKSVAATGKHTFDVNATGTVSKQPTCTAGGKKTVTCTVCKTATQEVDIPALGHKFSNDPDDAEITKEATCAEEGEMVFKCLNKTADGKPCPEVKKEVIPKLTEHTWDKGTVTTPATCVKKGVKTYKCTVEKCEETKTEELPLVNHSWDNGTITIEPTITEKGVSTHKCTVCGLTKTLEVPARGQSMDPDELATLKAAPNNAYGAKLNVEPWVIVQGVLNEEELKRVQSGWPFSVTLSAKNITSQLTEIERQQFVDFVADNQIIIAYLDITLSKQMQDDPLLPVETTTEMVDIALDMPEGLPELKKNMDRTFMVLRYHDGVVETVPTKLSEDGLQIIFQTDKFSTYALTYTDIRQESSFPVLPVFIGLMLVTLGGVLYLAKLIFIDRIFDDDDDDDEYDDDDDYDYEDDYEEEQPKRPGRRLHVPSRRFGRR